MDRTVIHLHIPKTAGTTLRNILMYQYEFSEVCMIYDDSKNGLHISRSDFISMSARERERFKAVIGHVMFGIAEDMTQEITYITCLREPLSRVKSLHNHLISIFPRWENAKVEDFIKREGKQFDNSQLRFLMDRKIDFGQCTREMLDTVKENIDRHFTFVGLTERFEETYFLAHKLLGWKPIGYAALNKKAELPKKCTPVDLTDHEIDLINEYNQLDNELYQFAQERFNKQLNELDGLPEFLAQLEILKQDPLPVADVPAPPELEQPEPPKRFARTCSFLKRIVTNGKDQ